MQFVLTYSYETPYREVHMKKDNYKSLDELVKDSDERTPLSTRVKVETKTLFDGEAKRRKLTVSTLAAAVLDDYANWLGSQHKKKG